MLLLVLPAALGLIYLFIMLSAQPAIVFDLSDPKTAQTWRIAQGEIEQLSRSRQGLKIKLKQGDGLLLSSDSPAAQENKLSWLSWQDAPYVKFFISPENYDRNFLLVWFITDRHIRHINFSLPAMAESVVVDTRVQRPWQRVVPFFQDEKIRQVGLGFQQQIEISRVEFRSVLQPHDVLKTIFQQLSNYEPIAVSSINFQYGLTILGHSYTMIFGLLVLIAGIAMLIFLRRKTCFIFFLVAVIGVMLLDFSRLQTLWQHAKKSYSISSLYDERYKEFRSRFGAEFAQLDQILRKYVGQQSRVAFPKSSQWLVMGETNWIWFLYQGEYENNNDRGANAWPAKEQMDYIFYYYPEQHVHDHENQSLLLTKDGQKVADVELVAEVSDNAKLLKIIHD